MKPKQARPKSAYKERATSFERDLNLGAIAEIQKDGWTVGLFILQLNPNRGKALSNLRFVLGFESTGIHTHLSEDAYEQLQTRLEKALQEIPPGIKLSFSLSLSPNDRDCQTALSELVDQTALIPVKFLLLSELARKQELKRQGIRKRATLQIYVTPVPRPQPTPRHRTRPHSPCPQTGGVGVAALSERPQPSG